MACLGLFFILGLILALLAVACFLMSMMWVVHVAMSYGAITTESAMCNYSEDFTCVKRTVRTSGVQIKTGAVWEANFGHARFSTVVGNFSGACRVTDSSDGWISLFALVPNAKEDAYMFEGFTPGEPTFQASSLGACNESAINYTLAPRPCSVETSSVSGGKQMCGEFTSQDVFAFNMRTLGSAGVAFAVGIVLLCIARCCATSSATSEGRDAKARTNSNGDHGAKPREDQEEVAHETRLLTGGEATPEQKDNHSSGLFNTICFCGRRSSPKPLSQLPH